ncbi:hypothetical protein BLA60_01525 [Actinophytocola xinjiangensis]|uniref:Hydantoinase/oxoprolinase N-terminal domain-containing protein n=1 Tax=Actinophytocola xinjiangensis TaxID=485602 RepID=A0A7Z0WSG7_9PSEU|nr:hypothetical protein BLA60_01525 [Actinophytocola xinjiangensis]
MVGVDSGGTFTDTVVTFADGLTVVGKALSTPDQVEVGVLNSIGAAARAAGLELPDLLARASVVTHGTTVGLNALLTGKRARVGLLTTAGFESTLAIAKANKTHASTRPRRPCRCAGANPAGWSTRWTSPACPNGSTATARSSSRSTRTPPWPPSTGSPPARSRRWPSGCCGRACGPTTSCGWPNWSPNGCRTFRCRCPRGSRRSSASTSGSPPPSSTPPSRGPSPATSGAWTPS